MRTAIIGCGFSANMHAQSLKAMGHQLVAVANHRLPKAQAFTQQWNVQTAVKNYQDLFDFDLDCIHVCTPPNTHFQIIKDVLNAGIHVVSEKPLCTKPAEAFELVRLAKEKNLVGAVNFNVRFHAACQTAKEKIAAENFGKICLIHGSYLQEFHVLPTEYNWRYQPELAGGLRATSEIGSHWIDLVRDWTGLEIEQVSANFGNFSPKRYLNQGIMSAEPTSGAAPIEVNSEDAAVIAIRFNNGAIGSLLLSEVSHGRGNRLSLEVSSPTRSIWWNSEEAWQLQQAQQFSGVNTQTNPFAGGFTDTFQACFESIYHDIAQGHPVQHPAYPTFYDGFVNAAVCAAIEESAHHNAVWVKVKL